MKNSLQAPLPTPCQVVVIWIDWYPYHLARFNGLQSVLGQEEVAGIELVGGVGVHDGLKFREDRPEGMRIETLLPNGSWHTASKLGLSIALWKSLSRLNPAVVLIPGYYMLPAFAAMFWARLKGRTSVLMSESTAIDHARTGWKEALKSKLVRTMFDWAVVGGEAHVRYLRQLGFPSDRIAHFYDVVGNERVQQNTHAIRQASSAAAHGLPEHYFLFIGRLAEEKNVCGLVRDWLEYRRRGGTWALVMAGDGPELPKLRQMLAGSAYQNVSLVGHKSSRELLPLFAFADCFVLPSTREPWGLVVNEAMAASLPLLVSSRCGCAEDLVTHGQNGMVFDPADQEAMVSCMLNMEALPEVERVRQGAFSASRIARFSPSNLGHEIARIADWAYDQSLAAGRSGRLVKRSSLSEKVAVSDLVKRA